MFLTVVEAGKAMVKMPADSVSRFTNRTFSLLSPHGRGKGGLWGLFYKSTKPIHGASPLMV